MPWRDHGECPQLSFSVTVKWDRKKETGHFIAGSSVSVTVGTHRKTSQTRKGQQRLEFDVRSKLSSEIGVRVALRGGGTADAIMSERMSSSRR